jgi:hypothetical protein
MVEMPFTNKHSSENGNGWMALSEERWNTVEAHIKKYNEEFGEVEKTIATIQEDISWIKRVLFAFCSTAILLILAILGFLIDHIARSGG